MLEGASVTIKLTISSLTLGFVVGLLLAFAQIYGGRLLRYIVTVYERIFRSLPLLVILFLIFYGLPGAGLRLPQFIAAVIGIGLRSSAYQAQIFRGAIASIGSNQLRAAESISMSRWQAFFYIILPQALRLAIPGWANEFTIVLKDTSFAYALGVIELLRQGRYIIATSYEPLAIFLAIAGIYFIMTVSINYSLSSLEKKLSIPGIGQEGR